MIILVVIALVALAIYAARKMNRQPRSEQQTLGDWQDSAAGWAARRLPERRREWGQAMLTELAEIREPGQRWRFAAGIVKVAMFPPGRGWIFAVGAGAGAAAMGITATLLAKDKVPSLTVFAAVLSGLTLVYVAIAAPRVRPREWTMPQIIVGVTGIVTVAAAISVLVEIARRYPAATKDDSHAFSIILAVVMLANLAFALTKPKLKGQTSTVLWWALGGAVVSGLVWAIIAWLKPLDAVGVLGMVSPVGAVATLLTAIGAGAATRNTRAGLRAGLIAATLGALTFFTINLYQIMNLYEYKLTDPYDIEKFAKSGFPDTASFLISDSLGGEIISGLLMYPVVLGLIAFAGAAIGARGKTA